MDGCGIHGSWETGNENTVEAFHFVSALYNERPVWFIQNVVRDFGMTNQLIILLGSVVRIQEEVMYGANIVFRHADNLIEVALINSLRLLETLSFRYKCGYDYLHELCPLDRHGTLMNACREVKCKVRRRSRYYQVEWGCTRVEMHGEIVRGS